MEFSKREKEILGFWVLSCEDITRPKDCKTDCTGECQEECKELQKKILEKVLTD
jgi:hypothetical protein